MASAATAKRASSALGGNGGKGFKRSASRDSDSASAGGQKGMHNKGSGDTQNAISLSEKRRVAALISWEKRRKTTAKAKAARAEKAATAFRKKSDVSAIPVTPPKGRKQKKAEPAVVADVASLPLKKRKVAMGMTTTKGGKATKGSKAKVQQENDPSSKRVYTSNDRSQAAKLGWERKRKGHQAQLPRPLSSTDIRRQAAKLGWEKRRSQKAASEIRRKAAKLGWERRHNRLAAEAESSEGGSTSDDDDEDASDADDEQSSSAPTTDSSGGKKKSSAASRKVYSASARRQAAIRGWERRRNEKAARRNTGSDSSASDDGGVASLPELLAKPAPSKTTTTAAAKPQPKKETKQYRQGTKRSRRLAEESTYSHEDEARKINELVTYLRLTRGWMEFHPSSRHGSGTATYGYIPSSIAAYIQSGTISQRTVLEHGTLGIHYALDWDGYGGLRDMINTFGEDYAPFPTEEMMEEAKVTDWELGEDLPWREVEEMMDKEAEEEEKASSAAAAATTQDVKVMSSPDADDDMDDIMFVASILASLDGSAAVASDEAVSDTKECKQQNVKQAKSKKCSPSILALQGYDSSSDEDEDSESNGYNSDIEENNQTTAQEEEEQEQEHIAYSIETGKYIQANTEEKDLIAYNSDTEEYIPTTHQTEEEEGGNMAVDTYGDDNDYCMFGLPPTSNEKQHQAFTGWNFGLS